MEFDSPEVAKDFPGLYKADGNSMPLNDPAEYEEDEKGKKKKDKKDSKKDKGYATLAGESSHEEDELDPKSPAKPKKIKTSFKLSTKKKDKKSIEKVEKEKKHSDKEKTKSKDKEKKLSGEKDVKEDEKKTEKDKGGTSSSSVEKEKTVKEKEKEKKLEKEKKVDKKKKLSIGEKEISTPAGTTSPITNTTSSGEKEKEKGLNLNHAINAFLNAPAPLLLKKDKEHKKDKDSSSSTSKVKLKLKRSKNSLEDSHSHSTQFSDIPVMVSHQFPESSEAIVKEIKKYEALLEQTHSQMKSNPKVSKKKEEQLWELQRTLTQLKRKLRSINALSAISVSNSTATTTTTNTVNIPAALLPKPEPQITTTTTTSAASTITTTNPTTAATTTSTIFSKENVQDNKIKGSSVNNNTNNNEVIGQKINLKSETNGKASVTSVDEEMILDFTLKTLSSLSSAPLQINNVNTDKNVLDNNNLDCKKMDGIDVAASSIKSPSSTFTYIQNESSQKIVDNKTNLKQESLESSFSSPPPPTSLGDSQIQNSINNNNTTTITTTTSPSAILGKTISPDIEIERLQVQVQVHNVHHSSNSDQDNETGSSCGGGDRDAVDSHHHSFNVLTSDSEPNQLDATQLSSIIKTLTFSDEEEDDDDIDEHTDVSCLSIRNNPEDSITESSHQIKKDKNNLPPEILDPFEMPIFETEEYLTLENEALVYFNEELEEAITNEENEIETLMEQLIQMKNNGIDIDAPEIELDLDQFDNELISLWQITKLENDALNEHVNHLRKMVAVSKLEEFRLKRRLKYLEEEKHLNIETVGVKVISEENDLHTQSRL